MLLSSKHGQQYQCILPDLSIFEKANEENRISSNEEIPLLLDPLKKKCLYNVSYFALISLIIALYFTLTEEPDVHCVK